MYSLSAVSFLTVVLSIIAFLDGVVGQVLRLDAPIFVEGKFEDATATDSTYNTGGTITVGGFTMQVPRNLFVQFPAAWVPWKDFVASKSDFLGFETLVLGNTVLGAQLVGQVQILEFFEGMSFGFIESLNYTAGTMKIENGPTVRISDPNAVFTVGYTDAPFMTADDQSPSITSFSGFPMCIPRNSSDPLCPLSNRPFPAPTTFQAPDPYVMAPFMPGDFITFSGFRKPNSDEVIAFSIVAQNVQITTPPSIIYLRMELGLLGIFSPAPTSEVADSRFIGFTSHPSATITLYAMDIDPCTGNTSDRMVASFGLRGGRNFQNKFEYRNEILFGYTREYRATVEINGVPQVKKTKNGLMAGTYVQPVNVWVHAEQDVPGTAPVAHEFRQMGFLTRGVGKDAEGRMWGPLEPFPQEGGSGVGEIACDAEKEVEVVRKRGRLERRRKFGSRIAMVKVQAVADAENKGTEAPEDVVLAPAEEEAIEEKERVDAVMAVDGALGGSVS